ncbi:MAG: single-stranded DNA-binding protein [Bacteroidota bacterium]
MINKVILVGNVGKDPDVRYFDNNEGVAHFPLATTERGFTTRDGKEVPERTEWHNITAWRGLAKVAESYIRKGTQLYIEGKLRTRSYEQDGVTKYTTEIIAETLKLLGRKSDNPAVGDNLQTSSSLGNSSSQPSNVSSSNNNAAPQNQSAGNEGFSAGDNSSEQEDDLPF